MLIVDDDPDTRAMLVTYLSAHDIPVRAASSVAEALDALEHNPIRLVITDYAMPDRDGLDLVHALAAEPRFAGVRCAMMSGQSDRSAILGAVDPTGSIVFLRKPICLSNVLVLARRAAIAT